MSTVNEDEVVESVFYEISHDDEYSECDDLTVESHENDKDYPLSIVAETEDGRTIGVTLTEKTIRRIIAEAFVLGII
jgi:hypothetical protein